MTWLLYLNRDWRAEEGGSLRAYERTRPCDHAVGATDDGDVQVGWVGEEREVPVFLGEDEHGERVLYDATGRVRGGCAAGVAAPPLASIADAGARFCAQINRCVRCTPSSRCRVDGVTGDATILHEGFVKF